jgi:hypothetical protein
MIWKKMFPSASTGGGKLRRWTRFQKTMSKKRWFELDREKNGPVTLFDFSYLDDAIDAANVDETDKKGGWRISDDSVIGGRSKSDIQLIRTSDDYKRYMRGEVLVNLVDQLEQEDGALTIPDKEEEEGEEEAVEFVPFIRWKGTIDTRVDSSSEVQRSGTLSLMRRS